GADFDGEGLKCETASVDASSGGDADAFATLSANGEASSGGSVTFHGRPANSTQDTSSGGSGRARCATVIMNRLAWLASAAALAATTGCIAVSSETTTRTYDIAGFDSVSARSGVNVLLRQGAYDISAEGPKDKLDRLVIERQGSLLVISREPSLRSGWFNGSERD